MVNILVIGDSHAEVFNFCNNKSDLFFKVFSINSISANSSNKYIETFLQKCKLFNYDYILLMFGEKDCGFGIWNRCRKYNSSIETEIEKSIENLFNLAKKLLLYYKPEQIIFGGVHLPALGNYLLEKDVFKRATVAGNKLDRTNLTLVFNCCLRKKSSDLGMKYAEITNFIIDFKTGMVKDYFLRENKNDIHLNFHRIAEYWIQSIYGKFGKANPGTPSGNSTDGFI